MAPVGAPATIEGRGRLDARPPGDSHGQLRRPRERGGALVVNPDDCPLGARRGVVPDLFLVRRLESSGASIALAGGRWSAPLYIAGASRTNAPATLSCATARWCMALLVDGQAARYDGRSWTTATPFDSGATPDALSCPDIGRCVAVDDGGRVLRYAESSWGQATTIDPGGDLVSVTCSSLTYCLAVSADTPGTAYRFEGARWSEIGAPEPSTPNGGSEPDILASVSCSSRSFCAALDDFGEVFTFDGTAWSSPATFDNVQDDGASISCTSNRFCMIIDDVGDAVTLSSGSLARLRQLLGGDEGLTSVSCAAAEQCVAVGGIGSAFRYSPSSSSS